MKPFVLASHCDEFLTFIEARSGRDVADRVCSAAEAVRQRRFSSARSVRRLGSIVRIDIPDGTHECWPATALSVPMVRSASRCSPVPAWSPQVAHALYESFLRIVRAIEDSRLSTVSLAEEFGFWTMTADATSTPAASIAYLVTTFLSLDDAAVLANAYSRRLSMTHDVRIANTGSHISVEIAYHPETPVTEFGRHMVAGKVRGVLCQYGYRNPRVEVEWSPARRICRIDAALQRLPRAATARRTVRRLVALAHPVRLASVLRAALSAHTGTVPYAHADPVPLASIGDRYGLSQRELQVLAQVLDGATNRAISTRLGISESTTKKHLYSVYNKTGVDSRTELIVLARDDVERT